MKKYTVRPGHHKVYTISDAITRPAIPVTRAVG